jgi:RNA polymerase sigma-70 factor (ECF subfamily)
MVKYDVLDDASLIAAYKGGNEEAFAKLLDKYKNKVYTKVYLIVKDQFLAEDLLQEVFIKAIDKIKSGTYNEEGKFGPWIVRIAHNLAIDNFRKAKRYPTVRAENQDLMFNTMAFSEDSVEERQIKEDTNNKLKSLIELLPANQKEVLLMRHYADMSFQEIAESTGVSINTALGRMRYALINLKKQFEKVNYAYDKNTYRT